MAVPEQKPSLTEILEALYGSVSLDGERIVVSTRNHGKFGDDLDRLRFKKIFGADSPTKEATYPGKHPKHPGALVMQAILTSPDILANLDYDIGGNDGDLFRTLSSYEVTRPLIKELTRMEQDGDAHASEAKGAIGLFVRWLHGLPSNYYHLGPRSAGRISVPYEGDNCVIEMKGAHIDDFIIVLKGNDTNRAKAVLSEIRQYDRLGRMTIPKIVELFQTRGCVDQIESIRVIEMKMGCRPEYEARHYRHVRQIESYQAFTYLAIRQGPRQAANQPLLPLFAGNDVPSLQSHLIYYSTSGYEDIPIDPAKTTFNHGRVRSAAVESVIASRESTLVLEEPEEIIKEVEEKGEITIKNLFTLLFASEKLEMYADGIIVISLSQFGERDSFLEILFHKDTVLLHRNGETTSVRVLDALGEAIKKKYLRATYNKAEQAVRVDRTHDKIPFMTKPMSIEELSKATEKLAVKLQANLAEPNVEYSKASWKYLERRGIPGRFARDNGIGSTTQRNLDLAVIDMLGPENARKRVALGVSKNGIDTGERVILRAGLVTARVVDLEMALKGEKQTLGIVTRSIYRKELHCCIIPPQILESGRRYKTIFGDPSKAACIYLTEGIFDSLSLWYLLCENEMDHDSCVICNIGAIPDHTIETIKVARPDVEIIAAFDRDEAGVKANNRAVSLGAGTFWDKIQGEYPDLPDPNTVKDVNDLLMFIQEKGAFKF